MLDDFGFFFQHGAGRVQKLMKWPPKLITVKAAAAEVKKPLEEKILSRRCCQLQFERISALASLLSTSINGRHRCMLRRSCGKLVDHKAPHVLFCQACLHWPAHPSEPGLLAVHSLETSHVSWPMTIHQLGILNSKLGAHLHGSPCLARAPLCKLGESRCVDQAYITLLWSLKGRANVL